VKFTRTDLIARIEAEIGRRETAAAERTAKNRADYDKALAEHVQRTAEAWKEFGKAIARAGRAGRAIGADDVPRALSGGYNRAEIRVWDRKPPEPTVANTEAHRTLLELVKSCIDDEITDSAIARLGFKTAELFRS
jgi:hypothetical protein